MFRNRPSQTVVPTGRIEIARARMVELEDELERLADLAHQMGVELTDEEVGELELSLQEAEEVYWRAVDEVTDEVIAEMEDEEVELW